MCVAAVVLSVGRMQIQFHMCFLVNPGGTTTIYGKVHTGTRIDMMHTNKIWWVALAVVDLFTPLILTLAIAVEYGKILEVRVLILKTRLSQLIFDL